MQPFDDDAIQASLCSSHAIIGMPHQMAKLYYLNKYTIAEE